MSERLKWNSVIFTRNWLVAAAPPENMINLASSSQVRWKMQPLNHQPANWAKEIPRMKRIPTSHVKSSGVVWK